ncbi:extracellular matrix regulator RemB [Cytobacillus gottheilii]|uniref:extracellular matrix regulator RemB n=1 Tax=Cytobacillus gottheilii TaxID=859144 RepID=UPI0009BB476B|nr:extracellular matrix/biofilm biosynthesis regulator RemA family protein [Cytobacillus gottheilii]
MYIHVGEDVLVRAKDIVAIIDKESSSSSPYAEEFLRRYEKEAVNLSKSGFKSVVITTEKVYFSPLSSNTLKRRSGKMTVPEF